MRPIERFRVELGLSQTTQPTLMELAELADCPFSNYMLLSMLTHYLRKNPNIELTIDLAGILTKLTRTMPATHLWQLLHLCLWKHDAISAEQKQLCRYYEVFSQWITSYEQVISRAESEHRIFIVLEQFVRNNTRNYFERVVLLDESFDDIKAVVKYKGFWDDSEDNLGIELQETPSHENYKALLHLMQLSIYRSDVHTDALGVYSSQLFQMVQNCHNYQNLVYRSLKYMMKSQKLMHQKQMELTKLVLRYATFANNSLHLVSAVAMILTRSSKAVKFACMTHYQSLYAILQAHNRNDYCQELQSLHDFREVSLKKIDITELDAQSVLNEFHDITVLRGQSQTFYFEVTRPNTLIMLQLHLETNINLVVAFEGDEWIQQRTVYINEPKCTSRSLHIKVSDCGLHSVTFDNSYSWINSKRIRWHALVYRPVVGISSSFNLLFNPEEYVPWRGYHLSEVVSQQQNFHHGLWKRYLPVTVDIMFRGGKIYYRGQVSDVSTFEERSESLGRILTYVIEDEPQQYQKWVQYITEQNPQCQCVPAKHQ